MSVARANVPILLTLALACSIAALSTGRALAQGRTGKTAAAQEAMTQAAAALARGDRKQAAALYRRAIALNQLELAYERYGMLLFAQKRYRQGLAQAEEGLRHHPASAQLKAVRGANLFRLGKVDAAYGDLSMVARQRPEAFAVQAVTAQCCLRVGDSGCALAAIAAYLAHRPAALAVRDTSFHLLRARAQVRSGAPLAAEKTLQVVLRRGGSARSVDVVKAELLLARKAPWAALRVLEARPDITAEGRWIKGRAYLALGKLSEARGVASALVAKRPGEPRTLVFRGDVAAAEGRWKLASGHYRAVLAKRGGRAIKALRLKLARAEVGRGDRKAAWRVLLPLLAGEVSTPVWLLALRLAPEAAPQAASALVARAAKRPEVGIKLAAARAWLRLGRDKQAVSLLEALLAARPDDRGASALLYKVKLRAAGRPGQPAETRLGLLMEAKKLAPSSLMVARNLAVVALQAGKGKLALAEAEVITKRLPGDHVATLLASRALLLLGRPKEAWARIKALSLAGSKGATKVAFWLEQGATAMRAGDFSGAIKALDRAPAEDTKALPSAVHHRWRGTLARALLGRAASARASAKAIQRDVRQALRIARSLPAARRDPLMALAAVVSVARGDVRRGRVLLRQQRRRVPEVVSKELRRVALGLLRAYADYRSGRLKRKEAAIARLMRLSGRLPAAYRQRVRALAQGAREQLAIIYYRRGRTKKALEVFTQAMALLRRAPTARQAHNKAVLEQKRAATVFLRVRKQVPQALCNLAVLTRGKRSAARVLNFLKACKARKVRFPGLDAKIATYERLVKIMGSMRGSPNR